MMNCDRGFLHSFGVGRCLSGRGSEGSSPLGHLLDATNLYSVGPLRVLTMMQSYASAAKLRAVGPFSLRRHVSHVMLRVHTTSDRQSAVRPKASRECRRQQDVSLSSLPKGLSACRAQDDALLAGGDKAPEPNEQLACQGNDHRLARTCTAVGGASLIPQCQGAGLLKPQKR